MNILHIVYECDSHRSKESVIIKGIFQRKSTAIDLFEKGKALYEEDGYFLNVAEYSGTINYEMDNDLRTDMEGPYLTTEKDV